MNTPYYNAKTPRETDRLKSLFERAFRECDAVGIKYREITSVNVNYRAKTRWGRCRGNTLFDTYVIEVNHRLLAPEVSDKAALDTILHEICHTVNIYDGHEGEWLRCANLLNATYGYNIKRATSCEEKGVEPAPARVCTMVYRVQCNGCGHITERTKKSKVILHPELYRCTICNGSISRI